MFFASNYWLIELMMLWSCCRASSSYTNRTDSPASRAAPGQWNSYQYGNVCYMNVSWKKVCINYDVCKIYVPALIAAKINCVLNWHSNFGTSTRNKAFCLTATDLPVLTVLFALEFTWLKSLPWVRALAIRSQKPSTGIGHIPSGQHWWCQG